MSPIFYDLVIIVSICAVFLAVVEFRIRRLANDARKMRIKIEQEKKEKLLDYLQTKKLKR